MHPFKRAPQKDQVQAALFYGKHFESAGQMTATETRSLTQSVPNVHQGDKRSAWELTGTGERYLLEKYDVKGPPQHVADADVAALETLAARIGDDATRGYVDEAILCLKTGARRAAVVFLWTGAVSSIRDVMWQQGAAAIESALQVRTPKAKFKKK